MYDLNNSFIIKKTILGEEYLFNMETAEIYDLNETALFVLKNSINHCADYVIAKVLAEYDIENESDLEKEVKLIIEEFYKLGILYNKDVIN